MRYAIVILSLFGIMFVTGCSSIKTYVYDATGKQRGEIQIENNDNAVILGANGETAGRVRGGLVRTSDGKKAGTIETREEHVVIVDAEANEIGSLENETDCYGQTQTLLGRVSARIDTEAAAAACLLLFL